MTAPLSSWPWENLGSYKYLLYGPLVAKVVYAAYSGEHGVPAEPYEWCLHLIALALLRGFVHQAWFSFGSMLFLTRRRRIVKDGVDFDQIDQEWHWDNFLILQVFIGAMVLYSFPSLSQLPLWDMRGLLVAGAVHVGVSEPLFYWAHRCFHKGLLFDLYHSLHHSSKVLQSFTAGFGTPLEHIFMSLVMGAPILGAILMGAGSIGLVYVYILFFDFMRCMGHSNVEVFPHGLFDALPILRYLVYTPTYHSLHHTEKNSNYCLFMPLFDLLGGTLNSKSWELQKEISSAKDDQVPDFVFLAHIVDIAFSLHAPFILRSFSSSPFSVRPWLPLMWPIAFVSMLFMWALSKTFLLCFYNIRGRLHQTWLVPRYGFQYFLPFAKDGINDQIELVERYHNLSPRCSQPSLPPKPLGLGRRSDDAELSIFEAERYFNEGDKPPKKAILLNGISESCDSSTNPRDSSVSSLDGYGRHWRNRSFRATPTSSSEASWNSQSGLLSNLPGSVAVSVRAFPLNQKKWNGVRPSSSAGRRFFGRNCPCYGKKSVDVEEKYAEPRGPARISSDKDSSVGPHEIAEVSQLKISAGSWAKDSAPFSPEKPFPAEIGHRIVNSGRPFVESAGFSFPILPPPPLAAGADEPPRESLEVFQPSNELTNLRRSAELPRRPAAVAPAHDDDAASDTSSDLFEIESFSANSALRQRDSLDEFLKLGGSKAAAAAAGILQFRRSLEETTASIAPSECYAPSEVSVEWSVTTAEGGFDRTSVANFSSAASEYEEARFIQSKDDRFRAEKMAGSGEGKRKGGGGLLSCRCENSVNVGPNPVRIGSEQQRAGNAVFADEPVRVLGTSRFALEKAELVRSHSVRVNRPIQTR